MVFYKIQLEHYLLIFGVIICGIAEKKHGQGMLKYTSFFLQSNHNLNLHLYFNEPQPIQRVQVLINNCLLFNLEAETFARRNFWRSKKSGIFCILRA